MRSCDDPLSRLLARFLADESGATAIEYALIVSGIALALIVSLNALGTAMSNTFTTANTTLN